MIIIKRFLSFKIMVLFSFVLSTNLYSQVQPPNDFQIYLSKVTGEETPDEVLDTLTDPFFVLLNDTALNINLSLVLPDTSNISFIHISLKSEQMGLELMNYAFIYDQSNLTNGLTYNRNGNYVELGIGILPNTNQAIFFAEAQLEDNTGNKSEIIYTTSSNN